MKNLPGVLVFSAALLLAPGCQKNTGVAPGPTDAAASSGADPRDAMEAVRDSGAAPSAGTQPGTHRGAMTSPGDGGTVALDAGTPGMDAGTPGMDAGPGKSGETQEACVDRWLKANGLDKYGHPAGTMYAGGTPLFDERTGERRERLDYVFERKPEARKACAGGAPSK